MGSERLKVILNSINGIPDAIEAMFFSKRTWTEELHYEIRYICHQMLDKDGLYFPLLDEPDFEQFDKWLDMVCQMTKKPITIGKFIDFSFIVIGLHRAGQDDWDAHAERFDNRIIRNSTRLATFDNEKSDYYKDKILTTDEALDILEITAPNEITFNGKKYVKTVNGYILEEYKDNKDVKRGLYMLSIPSNFIFKCNLTQFSHVYKERYNGGSANPEVKECAEKCLDLLNEAFYQFNRELMLSIKN